MEIQKYIESGKLEAYLFGLLTPAEQEEVEQMAAKHAEIREALRRMEEDLAQYALAKSTPLSPAMTAQILETIDSMNVAAPKVPADTGSTLRRWVVVLATLATLVSLACIYLFAQMQQQRLANTNLQLQLDSLSQNCDQMRQDYENLRQEISIPRNPNLEHRILDPLPDASQKAIAAVHVDLNNKQVYLDASNLPALPAGKQYQFWVIVEGNPNPVSLDPIDLPNGFQLIAKTFAGKPVAFALSVEPEGGSTSPTEVVSVGAV